jgi:hypothetical protein
MTRLFVVLTLMILAATGIFAQSPALQPAGKPIQTSLAENLGNNDSTMRVQDCSTLAPNTLLRVDSEIVYETLVSTDCRLTVARALGGTTAAGHKTGAVVSAYVATGSITPADVEIRAAELSTVPTISVKAFGAAGDGARDDTPAIQNAINAASPGDIVFVPAGSYLTGAIRVKSGVELRCASMQGSTFLASSNDEVMFTFSATSYSGISNCAASGNGKKGVKFLEINTFPAVNNKFRDLYVHDVATGIHTSDTYFDTFDNVRVFQPTTAGFLFSVNSNSITCTNCSTLSMTPGTIGLQVNNSGAFVFNGGTLEGTVSTKLYQLNAATFIGTYWENTGSVNAGAWVDIGTDTGTKTGGINFIGCSFSVGAYYALNIVQVDGLVARGNSIATQRAAFYIDNRGDAPKSALDLGNNQYGVDGHSHDPVTIYSFAMASDNTLNSNINQDVTNPLLFSATPEPSDASIFNGQGVVYFDSHQRLWYKSKDGAGNVHRWLIAGDVTTQVNPDGSSGQTGLSFANLPKAVNGTMQYCTDCKNIQDGAAPGSTAVGGGTGAFLAGIKLVWRIMN